MVYKKYVKKRGRSFGPYYYESYREGNKVKKIYIGGEKEYKEWIKKKKSVEQPSKKNKNLISRIQSASKNLLNIPSYAYQKSENSTNQKKQVYTISSKDIPDKTRVIFRELLVLFIFVLMFNFIWFYYNSN